MDLKDFAAHVIEKFKINKIEPWTGHFPSTDAKYLEEFRPPWKKQGSRGEPRGGWRTTAPMQPIARSASRPSRSASSGWTMLQPSSRPSIRTNIPRAKDSQPDLDRAAESLARVAEYASTKNIVVTLENDNPVSEDPFFLVALVEKVNSPWLHTLPDFGNTLAAKDPDYAYRGIDAMFGQAYCISHVKSSETNSKGITVHVDMAKTFGCYETARLQGLLFHGVGRCRRSLSGNGGADQANCAISFLRFHELSVAILLGPVRVKISACAKRPIT